MLLTYYEQQSCSSKVRRKCRTAAFSKRRSDMCASVWNEPQKSSSLHLHLECKRQTDKRSTAWVWYSLLNFERWLWCSDIYLTPLWLYLSSMETCIKFDRTPKSIKKWRLRTMTKCIKCAQPMLVPITGRWSAESSLRVTGVHGQLISLSFVCKSFGLCSNILEDHGSHDIKNMKTQSAAMKS